MENINLLDPDIRIDYRQHPAFASLPQSGIAESTEQTIYSLFKEVDDVTALVAQSKEALDNKIINNITDRILSPIFSEILKVTMDNIADSCRLKSIVPNIIKQTFETLLEDIHFNNGSKLAEVPIINAPTTRQVYEDLKNKGISVKKLPNEYIQTLWNLTLYLLVVFLASKLCCL